MLGRFRAELEDRLRWERVSLGKAHSEAVREIESKAGEVYRSGMEGSEERAREAARTDGLSVRYRYRDVDWYRLTRSVLEERGAGAGDRWRAGLREDEAGNGEGNPSGEGKPTGEDLAVSVAQRAGAPWTETRRAGTRLWPQPLGLSSSLWPNMNAIPERPAR